jgi:16S rRNA (uracil1498-N3)-methyltransferase
MSRLWRIHCPNLPASGGATVELTRQEGEHLRRVLRLGRGDPVVVFDGIGGEWRAKIVQCERRRVAVRLLEPLPHGAEPELDVRVFQALCKPERLDWLVQKATEVGVRAVCFFHAERSGPQRATPNRVARWRRIAVEACKQSGRSLVPEVELLERPPAELPSGDVGLLLDPSPGTVPLAARCAAAGPAPGGVRLAVGPEGGLEPGEIEAWTRAGWQRTGLGPRVLRAETAGVVAASILLHLWGDLGSRSAPPGGC